MAVVDGPFNFMGYKDNEESPPTDSDQPCSSSSYKPTPTSVSTEAVTLINNSTEGPDKSDQKGHCHNHRQSATRTVPTAYIFRKDEGDHI